MPSKTKALSRHKRHGWESFFVSTHSLSTGKTISLNEKTRATYAVLSVNWSLSFKIWSMRVMITTKTP
jgi:hypothetical protein